MYPSLLPYVAAPFGPCAYGVANAIPHPIPAVCSAGKGPASAQTPAPFGSISKGEDYLCSLLSSCDASFPAQSATPPPLLWPVRVLFFVAQLPACPGRTERNPPNAALLLPTPPHPSPPPPLSFPVGCVGRMAAASLFTGGVRRDCGHRSSLIVFFLAVAARAEGAVRAGRGVSVGLVVAASCLLVYTKARAAANPCPAPREGANNPIFYLKNQNGGWGGGGRRVEGYYPRAEC